MRLSRAALPIAVYCAPAAHAAPCNRPDLIESLPPDGAADVPTNAVLTARYAVAAEYLGEPVSVAREGSAEVAIQVAFDAAEGLLRATPEQPLEAEAEYVVTWPELRGVGTASLGRGGSARFVTGAGGDESPPVFEGLTGVDWHFEREMDDCTDRLEDRFVFDVELSPARDDGAVDALLLRVFQTRGPRIDPSAPEPVLVRRWPSDALRARVVRTESTGLGRVCFSAVVTDLVGQPSGGADRESCLTTVEPPYFEGCSLARGQRPAISCALLAVLGAAGALRRRQRRQ